MLEIWGDGGRRLVPLVGERMCIGKAATNEIVLDGDPAVSHLHAVLECLAGTWTVRDVGSRNGTHLNGERVFETVVLRTGDQIRLGSTEIVFRVPTPERTEHTEPVGRAPDLTPRERDVLRALCRPLVGHDLFCEPASLREMAAELNVSDDAVKKHLAKLYEKFDIPETGGRRRARLANASVMRGAVSIGEIVG
jgi:pSer/pThr/pTyr-binding forkhead associated (FHA) protein